VDDVGRCCALGRAATTSAGAQKTRAHDAGTHCDQAEREEKTLGIAAVAIGLPAAVIVVVRSAAGRTTAGVDQGNGLFDRGSVVPRRDVVMARLMRPSGRPPPSSWPPR
jgi:hypothetical protein